MFYKGNPILHDIAALLKVPFGDSIQIHCDKRMVRRGDGDGVFAVGQEMLGSLSSYLRKVDGTHQLPDTLLAIPRPVSPHETLGETTWADKAFLVKTTARGASREIIRDHTITHVTAKCLVQLRNRDPGDDEHKPSILCQTEYSMRPFGSGSGGFFLSPADTPGRWVHHLYSQSEFIITHVSAAQPRDTPTMRPHVRSSSSATTTPKQARGPSGGVPRPATSPGLEVAATTVTTATMIIHAPSQRSIDEIRCRRCPLDTLRRLSGTRKALSCCGLLGCLCPPQDHYNRLD